MKSPSDYAMQRGDIWLAGHKAVENGWASQKGQIISEKNQAVKFYRYRQTMNQRRNIMREHGDGPLSESEAAKIQKEINTKLTDAESKDEEREIWRSNMAY